MAVNQCCQILFPQGNFPVTHTQESQVQDLELHHVEPCTVGLGPLISPVQIPPWSLPVLQQINPPAQLGNICKMNDGALHPLIQILDKERY